MIAAVPRTMDAMPAKITHPRPLSLSPPAYVPAVIVSALMASSLLRCRPSCESLMTVVHGRCHGGGGSNVREIAECGGVRASGVVACQPAGRAPARSLYSGRFAERATFSLSAVSAFSSDERVLSTTIRRRMDPLGPVKPSCTELLSV